MPQSREMWERLLEQVRRMGPRRLLLVAAATAAAIVFAYGNHTSDNASGRTLARPADTAPLITPAHRP